MILKHKALLAALTPALFLSTLALGEDTPKTTDPRQLVLREVVEPLKERFKRQSMFSRARMAPPKVETLVAKHPHRDAEGGEFITFELLRSEARFAFATAEGEPPAMKSFLRGCVYPQDGDVWLKVAGDAQRASFVTPLQHELLTLENLPAPFTDPPEAKPKGKKQTSPRAARSAPCQAAAAQS